MEENNLPKELKVEESFEKSKVFMSLMIKRIEQYKKGDRSLDIIKLDLINLAESFFSYGYNKTIEEIKDAL